MKEYNALLGEKIDLDKAKELLKLALDKEQLHLSEVLKSSIEIAERNGIEVFEIVTPFMEQVKSSYLSALERLPDYIDTEELEGLNASVTTDDIYTMITNKLIERIKVVSSSDYKKKWDGNKLLNGKGFLTPMNYVSKKVYRGINFFMLKDFDIFKVFKNPYFLTFKQIQNLKGKLKKGSKGHEVVYFTMLYKIHLKDSNGKTVIDFGTYNKKRFQKYINDNWSTISQYTNETKDKLLNKYIPIIKYYNVFNGEDIEGIDFQLEKLDVGKLDSEKPSNQEHQLASAIVRHYPKPQPSIAHGGDSAAYLLDQNSIVMPHPEFFETIQDYYRTLFHELTHNSGDIKHLDREIVPYRKDPKKYAFEELIAEFGAVFLSAQAGFLWKSNKNHAAYIKSWNRALTIVEEDNRFIMRAASEAQKASDYILNLDENGEPAYFKDLKNELEKDEKPKKDQKTTHYTKEKFMSDLPDAKTVGMSYRGMSFSYEKRGKDEVEEWGSYYENYYNKMLKKAIKHDRSEEFKSAFDTYYPRLLKRKLAVIDARGNVMSTMITGRGNFPVKRQEKAHDRYDDRMRELFKYEKYMDGKIKAVIYNREAIVSGESDTLKKLKEKLAKLEEEHQVMLNVNKAHRAWHKDKDDSIFKKYNLQDNLIKQIKAVPKNDRAIPSFMLTNSRQNINATKKRIKAEKKHQEKYSEGNKETEYTHFTIVENVDNNRLQVIFNERPSDEVIAIMKKGAFRWARSQNAWQRQLTKNAISRLRQLLPEIMKEYKEETVLNAPWHEGIAKEALTTCGRLKPGYRYKKGGEIVKVKDKKKERSKRKANKVNPTISIGHTDNTNRRFRMKDIKLDEKRFQNRSKQNEEVVSNIVNNFKATGLDPLVIWLDPKDNEYYLLAGHHRYEALRRLKRKTAPVRIANEDYPTEKDAIRYARELSNANRTLEQPHERAAIYRAKIKEGITKTALEKEASIEGRNRSFVLNLAYLSKRGKALQAVIQFADSASVQDKNEVDKIADWIGQARRNNSELTNAHENEMYDFLTDSNASKRVTNKAQFLQLITSTTNDMLFDYADPLNLKRFKYQSEGEKQYDKEVEELREQIADKQKSITDIQDRFTNPNNPKYVNANSKDYYKVKKTADKRIATINEEIRSLQRKLQELYHNKSKYTNAGSNQVALFGAKGGKINISTDKFDNFNKKELREFLLDYYNNFLKGSEIAIDNSLRKVELLNRAGRKIAKGSAVYMAKTAVIEHFEEVLKNSTYNNWGKPKKGDSIDLLGYMNFKSKVNIDGQKRHVRISIEVFKDKRTLLKTYEVGKKMKPQIPKESPKRLSSSVNKTSSCNKNTKLNSLKKLSGVSNILSKTEIESEFYKIPGAVGEFLQQVEKKPVHSVVITLDGAQGAGKTTTLYRFINSFATAKKPCVFFSLEEHPQSHLARVKASEYIDAENIPFVDSVGDLDNKEHFYNIVDLYDFIFIDSWQKLLRMIGNIRLDEDLRKRFDGKVFVIIFQQTTTGRTKGGAEVVFDGDIIIKMVKEPRFQDNYAYMDKNRYTLRPIDELRYNIAGDFTYSTHEEEEVKFNFHVE